MNTSLYNGLCEIIVENTSKKSNTDIINDLKEISASIGSDIFCKTAENNGKLTVIYKTNNTEDFLNTRISFTLFNKEYDEKIYSKFSSLEPIFEEEEVVFE